MSNQSNTNVLRPDRGSSNHGRVFAKSSAAPLLGVAAGLGLLLLAPGLAHAGDYGHAEITLGFPHGQVTVGHDWGNHPREIIVEGRPDRDCDRDDEVVYRDEDDDEPDVVIEHRHGRHHHRHVVIERYEDPPCDRDEEVAYIPPPYPPREVVVYRQPDYCPRPNVVYREPERVIYAPSRQAIVVPQGGHEGPYQGGGYGHGGGYNQGGNHGYGGPKNLFPEDSGRPSRVRGVQQHLAQAGG